MINAQQAEQTATRSALAAMKEHGFDMSQPLLMDFFVAVPNEAEGHAVANRVRALGFSTKVVLDDKTQTWTCTCSKIIVPDFDTVWSIERQLDALSYDVGGSSDGFGSLGNLPPAP